MLLTEGTDWLGGQLTSQAVPPDENPWIERFGCTARYRRLREAIRAHYRAFYPLSPVARAQDHLNPGAGRVSSLCHEPRVAVAVLEAMLAPYRSALRIEVLLEHSPVAASVDGDRILAVTLRGTRDEADVTVSADWFIDATETGELLPLCGAEYVTGAESREATGEPHAPREAQPLNMQPVSSLIAPRRCAADRPDDRRDGWLIRAAYPPPVQAGGFLLLDESRRRRETGRFRGYRTAGSSRRCDPCARRQPAVHHGSFRQRGRRPGSWGWSISAYLHYPGTVGVESAVCAGGSRKRPTVRPM